MCLICGQPIRKSIERINKMNGREKVFVCTECFEKEGGEVSPMGPVFLSNLVKCYKCEKPLTRENFHCVAIPRDKERQMKTRNEVEVLKK